MKTTMSNPLVTVAIPLYNHQNYIEDCLRSVVEQDYKNIELIVIDDGSPDNSYEIAKAFLESQSLLTNYTLKTRANKGMCNTLNEIVELSSGKYFSVMGSDDCWLSDKINDQVNYLEGHEDVTLVHSNSIVINGEGKKGKLIDYSNKVNCGLIHEDLIYRRGGINTPSILFKTSVFDDIGYYDPDFKWEDTDFFLRLTKQHKIGFINKAHTLYRRHDDNMSHNKNRLTFLNDELMRICQKNIDNPVHLKYLTLRIYKKSAKVALKSGRIFDFVAIMSKYWRVKLSIS